MRRSRKPVHSVRVSRRTLLAGCAATGTLLPEWWQLPAQGLQLNSDEGATAGGLRAVKGRHGCILFLSCRIKHSPLTNQFHHVYHQCTARGRHCLARRRTAGWHLWETWASLPPICCGVQRAFKDQEEKQEPGAITAPHSGNSCCQASRGLHPAAHTKKPCSWSCSQGDLPRGRQLAKASKSFSSS